MPGEQDGNYREVFVMGACEVAREGLGRRHRSGGGERGCDRGRKHRLPRDSSRNSAVYSHAASPRVQTGPRDLPEAGRGGRTSLRTRTSGGGGKLTPDMRSSFPLRGPDRGEVS